MEPKKVLRQTSRDETTSNGGPSGSSLPNKSRLRTNDATNSPAMQRLRIAADPKLQRQADHYEEEKARQWEEEQREEKHLALQDSANDDNEAPASSTNQRLVDKLVPDLSSIFKKVQEAAGLTLSEIPSALFDAEDIELAVWAALVNDNFLRKLARSNERRMRDGVPIGSQLRSAALDHRQGAVNLLANMYNNQSHKNTNPDEPAVESGDDSTADTHDAAAGTAIPAETPAAPALPKAEERVPFDGIRSLIIPHAYDITDAGLLSLARSCTNLRRLNIARCMNITDVAVRALAKQNKYLEEVDISQCPHVQGAGLVTIGECCNRLRILRLRECPASEEWLLKRIATGLPELREIDLSRSVKVTDDTIRTLASHCRSLEKVVLAYCRELSDVAVLALSEFCPGLEYLDLTRNALRHKITDVCLLSLAERCPALSTLLLAGNDFITDVGISWLASGCHALEKLTLNGLFKVSDAGMRALGDGCPELHWLDISGIKQVSDVGMRYLADGCKHLHRLECANVYMLTDGVQRDFGIEGLQALVSSCREIQYLNLTQCFQVGPRILRLLSEGIDPLTELKSPKLGHALRVLSLRNMPRVSASALEPLLSGQASTTLTKLDLAGCEGIKDRVMRIIGRYCQALEVLNVSNCMEISSRGVTAMCRVTPPGRPLRELNFAGCRHIGDLALLALSEARYDPGLEKLNLRQCESVSETGLAWLAEKIPSLLEINVFGCNAVSYRGLVALAGHWRYTHVQKGIQFLGIAPDEKCKDMRFIDEYGNVWKAAILIQNTYRARVARRETARRREIRLMHWTARRLQAYWRGRVARRYVILKRLQRNREIEAATRMQSMFRARQARKRAAIERERVYKIKCEQAAILIQNRWRSKLARDLLRAARLAHAKYMEKCNLAATRMQQIWRGRAGRKHFAFLRAMRLARMAEEEAAATKVQALLRGRRQRRKAEERKRLEALEEERRIQASIKVQRAARVRLARRKLAKKREGVAERERAAIKLQCMWRAKQGSLAVHLLRSAKRMAITEKAALKVQAIWRGRRGKLAVQMIRQARAAQSAAEEAAAERMQCMLRKRLARRKVVQMREEKEDLVRRQHDLDEWAAVLVQKHYRGRIGRKRANIFREERKRRWKQMHDMAQDRPFYYNQDTGEVRWRMPQDMLDLLPRPICTNCESVDAYVECGVCTEYFCEACWNQVHYGGFRKEHIFRALYDAYEKRIDYGDGEWPSIWPTEIEQDDRLGWHRLKRAEQLEQGEPVTAGIPGLDPNADVVEAATRQKLEKLKPKSKSGKRKPAHKTDEEESEDGDMGSEDGDDESLQSSTALSPRQSSLWQKLWDHENEREIYLHRKKQRVKFSRPQGYESPREEHCWKEYVDDTYHIPYWYNYRTGVSTYENPLERSKEKSHEEKEEEAEKQHEIPDPIWSKLFEEHTGRAFYHNSKTGISVYERPAEYESPREDISIVRSREANPIWSRYVEEDSGTPYYYNHETHVSQFDRPPGYETPREDRWMKFFDESAGRAYYYNETSGVSQFLRPDEFETPRPDGYEEGANGWIKYADPQSAAMLYENTITGVMQYERPSDFAKPVEDETGGVPTREAGSWQEFLEPVTRRHYYYNIVTGESTYETPLEFREDVHGVEDELKNLVIEGNTASEELLPESQEIGLESLDFNGQPVCEVDDSWKTNADWTSEGVRAWLNKFKAHANCLEITTVPLRPEVREIVIAICDELEFDVISHGFGRNRPLVISKIV